MYTKPKVKKIAWESWNVIEEEIKAQKGPSLSSLLQDKLLDSDEEEMEDDMDDALGPPGMFFMPQKEMIETPVGIFNEDSFMLPSKRWDCWLGYTNFEIKGSMADLIESIEGVEALRVLGRYTFFVGVAKLFEISDVRKDIEEGLCTYTEEEILSDINVSETVDLVKSQLDKEKFWSIMVLVDGSVEYVSSNEMNKAYLDSVAKLTALKNMVGGIIIHNND
jgi:hypothetical protein